jgi:hypothetical protein
MASGMVPSLFDRSLLGSNATILLCMIDDRRGAEPQTRLSVLAVVGFVLAVIPGCPPVNLVGAVLGLLAGRRIDASPHRLRGRGLARAAVFAGVCLGLLSTIGLVQLSNSYQQRNQRLMTQVTEQFLTAAMGSNAEQALENWVGFGTDRPDGHAVQEFGALLEQRYGPLERVQILASVLGEGLLAPHFEAALLVYFQEETCTGVARYQAVVVPGRLLPDFLLVQVTIDDEERGEMRLGVSVDG